MKTSEKYKSCTAKGCQEALNNIQGLDDNVTIKEMRTFLDGRIKEANQQFETRKKQLISKIEGKCFKIIFSPEHTVLLKVDKVKIVEIYGSVEAIMTGEQIVKYKGELRWEALKDESDKKYSNYFPNDKQVEFDVKEFNKIKKVYNSISF